MNEDALRRLSNLESELEVMRGSIYGTNTFGGLAERVKIMEMRLQIFWWVLAIIGSTAIALATRAIFKSMGME